MMRFRFLRARNKIGISILVIVVLSLRIFLEYVYSGSFTTTNNNNNNNNNESSPATIEKSKSQRNPTPSNNNHRPAHLQQEGGFQKRYSHSFQVNRGSGGGGGPLPLDTADFLQSETMWNYLNDTCVQDGPIAEWQYRLPYVILLGAMKCGTHALTESLWEHPLVARNQYWELHFFDSDKPVRSQEGIHAFQTRQAYVNAFRQHSPEFFEQLRNTKMIAMESAPRYLLNSDRIPQLILCTVPWVKFLVLVRDPITRAESQYRYLYESRIANGKPMVDWKPWIDDDLRLLREAGVFAAKNRDEERLAWKRYQRRPNSNMIVGRGFYVLQLLDYFDVMDAYNKPRSDMLILQSERFRRHQQSDYNKVLNFLGLPPYALQNVTGYVHATQHKEDDALAMPASIKEELKKVYQPYNERLYTLLQWRKDLHWDETVASPPMH